MSGKILVTGAGGLLGHAVREVCPEAVFLTSRDGDLRDLRITQNLFEKYRPDYVLHLAAKVGGVKANREQNADFFTDNVQINANVLSAAQHCKVKALISILSSCAYRFYSDRSSTEEDLHEGMPFEGNLGYGYAKRMLDLHSRLLSEQYGCRFATLTPATMYGPHDNFDLEKGHVIAALMHKCLLARQQKKPLEVWGSGKAVRQFVYVKDAAKLLVNWLEKISGAENLIMAPDAGISIRELAYQIAAAMDFKGDIHFDTAQPEGELVRRLESKKCSNLFPDFTFTPMNLGLQETAHWFIHDYKNRLSEKTV